MQKRVRNVGLGVAAGVAVLGASLGVAWTSGDSECKTKCPPAQTVTETRTVTAPPTTVTEAQTVTAPPTTVTQTVTAPPVIRTRVIYRTRVRTRYVTRYKPCPRPPQKNVPVAGEKR